jgi:hypothetical protein
VTLRVLEEKEEVVLKSSRHCFVLQIPHWYSHKETGGSVDVLITLDLVENGSHESALMVQRPCRPTE